MRQRGYVIAFVVVLLLACVGGFFGGRLLLERLQADFAPRTGWTPQVVATAAPGAMPTSLSSAPIAATTPAPRPTATTLIVSTPAGMTITPGASSTALLPEPDGAVTPTLEPTATETASPAPQPAFPYALARPARQSAGDCPGVLGLAYVLGQVTDRSGTPLTEVRLKLVDEYGNTATTVSKSSPTDAGRYDFPVSGPARRLFLTVVDGAGRPLSAEVEIRYGLPPNPDATCYWVDWRRQ